MVLIKRLWRFGWAEWFGEGVSTVLDRILLTLMMKRVIESETLTPQTKWAWLAWVWK